MRRRITAALLAVLMSVGFTAAVTGVSAAPAAADNVYCC